MNTYTIVFAVLAVVEGSLGIYYQLKLEKLSQLQRRVILMSAFIVYIILVAVGLLMGSLVA